MCEPPAILSVYFVHKRGGLCERLELLLRDLDARGWSVHYASAAPFPWASARMVHHRVPAPSVERGVWFWLAFTLSAPWVVLRAAKTSGARTIIVFDPFYALIALPACWLLGCALMVSFHSDARVVHRLQRRSRALLAADAVLEAVAAWGADRVHTVSGALKTSLESRHERLVGRITHIPNDIRPIPPPSPELVAALRQPLLTLVTASILDRRKNVGFLLDALARVPAGAWRLVVVGEGPERAALERQARAAGIDTRVDFVGWSSDVQPFLAAADVFVLPSIHEGNPLALLEALGAGLACLGSDVPEIREVLVDERLLFPLDDPAVLGGRLRDLILDPAELEDLRSRSRDRANSFRFDWPEAMRRWMTEGSDRPLLESGPAR